MKSTSGETTQKANATFFVNDGLNQGGDTGDERNEQFTRRWTGGGIDDSSGG